MLDGNRQAQRTGASGYRKRAAIGGGFELVIVEIRAGRVTLALADRTIDVLEQWIVGQRLPLGYKVGTARVV